jgi:hypothetical protein
MERKSFLPALGLESTDPRDGILIHPCHDDAYHYLLSIGYINPASGLATAESGVNLQDSLNRTLAIIGAIQKAYNTLPKESEKSVAERFNISTHRIIPSENEI